MRSPTATLVPRDPTPVIPVFSVPELTGKLFPFPFMTICKCVLDRYSVSVVCSGSSREFHVHTLASGQLSCGGEARNDCAWFTRRQLEKHEPIPRTPSQTQICIRPQRSPKESDPMRSPLNNGEVNVATVWTVMKL